MRAQAYARLVGEPLRTLETPDGRTLAFAVWGDPDGFPILGLHGTPGCRLERWPHEELYTELGVCLVTHDRAGYGQSDRRPGRSVADEVDDVRSLADELGFDRFGVTGGSGGGPHALACAALLPDRVVRATCRVGVAPLGDSGLEQDEWLAGMDSENVKEFGWALAGEEVLTRELEAEEARIKERVAVDPSTALEGFDLSEADRAQMARPETMQITRESTAERSQERRRRLGRRRSRVLATVGVRRCRRLRARARLVRSVGRARASRPRRVARRERSRLCGQGRRRRRPHGHEPRRGDHAELSAG